MKTLTLGISPCPNDVFIFSGIILNAVKHPELDFEVVYRDVEQMNRASQAGEFDVIKISYANYVRCRESYDLLDSGGALGRGVGPLLLANGNSTLQAEAEILVPGEFTTANFLLDFYLQRPVCKRAMTFDVLYDHLCATPGSQGVVIHEKRFTYAQDGLTLIADLGEHWERETGYAIPLGGIVIRRSLDLWQPVNALIRESLAWAYANEGEAFALCREYAQDMNEAVIRAHIGLYVNEFSDTLGDEGRAAVAFFLNQQERIHSANSLL